MDFDEYIWPAMYCYRDENFIENRGFNCKSFNLYEMDSDIEESTKTICDRTNNQELDLKIDNLKLLDVKQLAQETFTKLNVINIKIDDYLNEVRSKIEHQFEFYSGEIDIRIESLKAELDELNVSLRKKLTETKDQMKGTLISCLNKDELESHLKSLEENIKKDNITLDSLKELSDYKMKYLDLTAQFKRIKTYDFTITLNLNEVFTITEKDILTSLNVTDESAFKELSLSTHEFIRLKYTPLRVSQLKSGNYFVSSYINNPAVLYDENFKAIREFQKLADVPHDQFYIIDHACDTNGNLYITESRNGYTYKLNVDFDFIKICFTKCFGNIHCFNDKIYLCDSNIIRVLDLELNVISSKPLEAKRVSELCVLNDVACVKLHNYDDSIQTSFYKLPSFKHLNSTTTFGPTLPYCEKWFLIYDTGFHIFDQNGMFYRIINDQKGGRNYFGAENKTVSSLSLLNGNIFMCLENKTISKISLKIEELFK